MLTSRRIRVGFMLLFGLAGLLWTETSANAADTPPPVIRWVAAHDLGVEGQGWLDTKAPFDRLPARAEGTVREPVWSLSRQSAGLHLRFLAETPEIHARWTLTSANLAMVHMPATGVSGLDLYARADDGSWRWVAVGRPERQTNSVVLVSGLPPVRREYLLYLPLYNGVKSLDIGVPEGRTLARSGTWGPGLRKPMVFYGTSIQQGACATRAGMVHSAILGRRFNFPHINLGFSGNGRMEPEMAGFLAELDPSVYVLDCLPNMGSAEVTARVEPFVRRLRETHPTVPIVLMEDRVYADAFLLSGKRRHNEDNHRALRAAFERMQRAGVKHLHYIRGDDLLGTDGEGTVDSSHPNDLGFVRQAEKQAKVLGPLLRRSIRP